MKKVLFLLSALLLLAGCRNDVIKKPAKLIEEDKMTDIIYDLALLEAMRSQHQQGQQDIAINPKEYIYAKYHIDSLQFAESNHYYASDIGNYKKMYEKVAKRIEAEQKYADKNDKASGKTPAAKTGPDEPQIK